MTDTVKKPKAITKRVLSPQFMGSYPHLIKAVPYQEGGVTKGDPRFTLSMVFNPEDLVKFRAENAAGELIEVDIKKLAVQLAKEQFPGLQDSNAFKAAFQKGDGSPAKGWPFVDGNKVAAYMESKGKEGADRFKGKVVITAKTYEDSPPLLSYGVTENGRLTWKPLQRSSDVDMKKANELFQGGNIYGAELSLRCAIVSDTYFITFYINSVRYLSAGEPFGRKSMMDRFDGVYGGSSPHDPTAGADNMDDEIPF